MYSLFQPPSLDRPTGNKSSLIYAANFVIVHKYSIGKIRYRRTQLFIAYTDYIDISTPLHPSLGNYNLPLEGMKEQPES